MHVGGARFLQLAGEVLATDFWSSDAVFQIAKVVFVSGNYHNKLIASRQLIGMAGNCTSTVCSTHLLLWTGTSEKQSHIAVILTRGHMPASHKSYAL